MIWYPYEQMKTMKDPYKILDAEGVHLYTKDQKLIDSISSWWCMIHGYKHPELTEAIKEQADRFCHVMLGGLTHEPVEKLSAKLIPVMIDLSGISPEKKVNEISRDERKAFGTLIKALPMTVMGTRSFAEAIITQGGISVKDINPSTMESRLVPGLYFAGELVDIDGACGGYNLQWAWSSGHCAGLHAVTK